MRDDFVEVVEVLVHAVCGIVVEPVESQIYLVRRTNKFRD